MSSDPSTIPPSGDGCVSKIAANEAIPPDVRGVAVGIAVRLRRMEQKGNERAQLLAIHAKEFDEFKSKVTETLYDEECGVLRRMDGMITKDDMWKVARATWLVLAFLASVLIGAVALGAKYAWLIMQ